MQPYEMVERDWAKINRLDPAGMVVCSSGTAALHLALEALQLDRAKVWMSDFTMVACPRAVVMAGLEPAFVDCTDERMLMDFNLLPSGDSGEGLEGPLNILAVHIYGRALNMGSLHASRICGAVIEDLAEAHGVKPHEYTDAACWSFYKNKIVAGEEGGAVWFRNADHAAHARQLRSLGFTDAHDFNHLPRGHNYRMADALAIKVLSGMYAMGHNLELRREIEEWYNEVCPREWMMPRRDVVWVYDFRIRGMRADQQDKLVKELNECGIAARHAFKPMHTQAEFKDCKFVKREQEVSSVVSSEVVYLPVQPLKMWKKDCRETFALIRRVLGRVG